MKSKTPPPNGNNGNNGSNSNNGNQPREYRNIPEIDAKIDAYIRDNPKNWAYIQAMPRDRLERSLVLDEIQKLERQQRIRDGVMKKIGQNPEMKQAYETLLKGVPEEVRDSVMAQVATQTGRAITRSQREHGQTV